MAQAIDTLVAEHADLERQLSDPELHSNPLTRAKSGAGSRNWPRSSRPTAS